jgi:8-oxo-dGTP diphosphatase
MIRAGARRKVSGETCNSLSAHDRYINRIHETVVPALFGDKGLNMSKRVYPNVPRVGVGAIVIHDDRVLLVRRGISPSKGLWAIPGGHVELGETMQETAEREILEETGLVVKAGEPVYAFDLIEHDDDGRIRFHYIVVDLMADYVSGEPKGGDDALEARWLSWEEIKTLPVSDNTRNLLIALKFGKAQDR